jgi:hypothetical protein
MYASMWIHPWDIFDEGVETILRRAQDLGMKAVNIAVSYHCGSYILPHNPKRRFFDSEEGIVYFKPDTSSYTNTILRPTTSQEFGDVLVPFEKKARDYGIALNAWVVCFHNATFARQHPELAVIDLYGCRNSNFICPNNPNSRNYLKCLVADLARNHDVEMIKLESATFPWALPHGGHHEMFGTYLEPTALYILATCFCDSCVAAAKEFNVDLKEIQKTLRRLLDENLKFAIDVMSYVPAEEQYRMLHNLTIDIPELYQLLLYKTQIVNRIFEEAKQTVRDHDTTKKLGIISGADWRTPEGIDLKAICRIVDQTDLAAYFTSENQVYYHTRWAREEVAAPCKLSIALRSNYPVINTKAQLLSQVLRALEGGADSVSFYNYGFTHEQAFEWIKDIVTNPH